MKTSRVLAIFTFFVLLTPAFGQIRIVQANVPFDFVVDNQVMPSGEYRFSLNGAGALRIARMTGNAVAGIIALPVMGNNDPTPRLVFHRYGNRIFLAQACVGETGITHHVYASAAELELAKATRQEPVTILASK